MSAEGFCMVVDGERLTLSFEDFPWFRGVALDELSRIARLAPEHLYWPVLDVDLTLESIRDPSAYPLVSRV